MEIVPNNSVSPFDAIKQTRPDGSEFWSARDLMPLLGYPTWQHFQPAIERAKLTASNEGHNLENLFTVNLEKSGGRPREDYKLSRYAAYLVALNGDPRKPEVAAAQSYFVVRTREAEVSTSNALPSGQELMALALVEAQNVLAAKNQKLAELEPIAEYYETNVSADDVLTIKDWGLVYGVQGNDAYEILKDKKLIYRKLIGERWSKKKQKTEEVYEYRIRKGTPSEWFSLRSQHNVERHHNGQVRQTLYVVTKYSVDIAKAAGIYRGQQEILEVA